MRWKGRRDKYVLESTRSARSVSSALLELSASDVEGVAEAGAFGNIDGAGGGGGVEDTGSHR